MISQQKQSRKQRCSVSFNLDRNQCHEFTFSEDVVQTDMWFTAGEFAQIQALANRESRICRHMGFSILLEKAYFFSGDQTLDLIQMFLQMNCEFICQRGFERRCSPRHAEERSIYRDQSIRSVIFKQRDLRMKGINFWDIQNKLALEYVRKSEAAGLFAQRIAQADESRHNISHPVHKLFLRTWFLLFMHHLNVQNPKKICGAKTAVRRQNPTCHPDINLLQNYTQLLHSEVNASHNVKRHSGCQKIDFSTRLFPSTH